MEKHFVLKTSQFKKNQRKIFLLKTLLGIFLVALIVGILSFITHSSVLAISKVSVSGNAVLSSEEIIQIATDNLSGNYLWIFPKNNFVIYPRGEIYRELISKFQRIESIAISTQDMNILEIRIKERKPFGEWCGTDGQIELSSGDSNCYLLDENGFIFDNAPQFSGNAYVRFYGGISGDPIGQNFLNIKSFKQINDFAVNIHNVGLPVIAFSSSDNGDYQFYLNKDSNTKPEVVGKITFDAKQDYDKAFVDLESVLNDSKTGLMGKDGRYNFQYIDLRYGDKVFYK